MSHDVEQLAHSDVRDLPRNAAAAEDDPMLGSRKSPTKYGFLSHGGTSIAGWFTMENPKITWIGGIPILGNLQFC